MRTCAMLLFGAALGLVVSGCGDSSAVSSAHASPTDAGARPAAPPATDSGLLPAAHDVLTVLSVEHQVDISTERDGVVVSIAQDEGSAV